MRELEGASYRVEDVKQGERIKKLPSPSPPARCSRRRPRTSISPPRRPCALAQQLYEGVEIKGHGTIGLITYLRTDSTRVAEEADQAAKAFIGSHYGSDYVAGEEKARKSSGKIQDAHEAIRPTDISLTPSAVKESLTRDLFRLYQLIWKRFTASG